MESKGDKNKKIKLKYIKFETNANYFFDSKKPYNQVLNVYGGRFCKLKHTAVTYMDSSLKCVLEIVIIVLGWLSFRARSLKSVQSDLERSEEV